MTSTILGHNLFANKKLKEAEPLLRASLAARRDGLPAGHWLIRNDEQYADTVSGFLKSAYGSLGDAFNVLQRHSEAKAVYEKGWEMPLALFLASCRDANFRDTARAIEISQQVILRTPQDSTPNVAIGLANYVNRDWQGVIDAVGDKPGISTGLICAMAYKKLGDALGAYWRGVAILKSASQADTDTSLFAAGNFSPWHGSFEEAAKSFRKSIELNPSFAESYWRLATALGAMKTPDSYATAEAIKKYFAINTKSPTAEEYAMLGNALRLNGEIDDSIVALKKAIELDPNSGLAYNDLGASLALNGRIAEAVQACREAMKLIPDEAGPASNLAWILATCDDLLFRDPKQAVELASLACKKKPDDSDCWNTLGVARYRNGEFQEAVDALKKAGELADRESESENVRSKRTGTLPKRSFGVFCGPFNREVAILSTFCKLILEFFSRT